MSTTATSAASGTPPTKERQTGHLLGRLLRRL